MARVHFAESESAVFLEVYVGYDDNDLSDPWRSILQRMARADEIYGGDLEVLKTEQKENQDFF